MKKVLCIILAFAFAAEAFAQKTEQEYLQRYSLLVNRVGVAGIGIETLVNNWEKDYPDSRDVLCAKFNYYYVKAQRSEVVARNTPKYLGQKAMLSLNDSINGKMYYFEDIVFDDSLFAMASQSLDKAIRLNPDNLDLRFTRISSLIAYEKESPDMATSSLKGLIDYNYSSHPKWEYEGQTVGNEEFVRGVQDYCALLFQEGTPVSYEAFRTISEKMLQNNAGSNLFLNNLGSYYFVVRSDSKTAMKYYNKVLKSDPENYIAVRNCVLIARKDKNLKSEKKYLPLLIELTESETEKAAAQARLTAISSKK